METSGDPSTDMSGDPSTDTAFDLAFSPPDAQWTGVSPQLAKLRRTVLVGSVALLALALAVILALLAPWWWVLVVLVVAVVPIVWGWRMVGRNVRSWGYTERAEDLLVRRGVVFRQLVVVPYGRMQFVDVEAGPLQRWFGVASVQLHTASASTDAHIPGLVPAEAARLRDRLAALGESQSAGL